MFARLKAQVDAGKSLTVEDYEPLLRLVKIAKDWNKAEESSALTEPEETHQGRSPYEEKPSCQHTGRRMNPDPGSVRAQQFNRSLFSV